MGDDHVCHWHAESSWANCLRTAGGDTFRCCHCYAVKTRTWTAAAVDEGCARKVPVYDDDGTRRKAEP